MNIEHKKTYICGFDRSNSIGENRYVCNCGWREPRDSAARTPSTIPDPQITLDAVVERDRKDAAIGRLVRQKLISGNAIPIERCVVLAKEVEEIDKASAARTLAASPDPRINPDCPVKSLGDS